MFKNTFLLHILFTSNNIFFVLLDLHGYVLFWTSSGRSKVKGLKKVTINSIRINLNILLLCIFKNNNTVKIHLKLKGFNKFKKIVIKQLKLYPINIVSIFDETISAHNGCKKKGYRKL